MRRNYISIGFVCIRCGYEGMTIRAGPARMYCDGCRIRQAQDSSRARYAQQAALHRALKTAYLQLPEVIAARQERLRARWRRRYYVKSKNPMYRERARLRSAANASKRGGR